ARGAGVCVGGVMWETWVDERGEKTREKGLQGKAGKCVQEQYSKRGL
nr:hypothetical protein [Tanacetum cinerariifolium]